MKMTKQMISPNPVGVPHKNLLSTEIEEVIKSWKENQPIKSWWKGIEGSWFQAAGYVIAAVDYFIRKIEELVPVGADKKATVLEAMSSVYDVIVLALLPFYLKPFNKRIKAFVIDVIASMMIDFLVDKYRSGNFVSPESEEADTTEDTTIDEEDNA